MLKKYLVGLALVLLTVGCGAASCSVSSVKEPEKALRDKGVLDVLSDLGDDEYDPPENGQLTRSQLEMYLQVKERELELSKVAATELKGKTEKLKESKGAGLSAALTSLSALKDIGNFATADLRAAQELGVNTAEYIWVKQKVVEAGLASFQEQHKKTSVEAMEKLLTQLKETRDKASNAQQKELLDKQIKTYQEQIEKQQAAVAEDPAQTHNRALIAEYGDELKFLEAEIKRYGLLGADQER